MYKKYVKRIVDTMVALVGFLVLIIPMIIISIAIKIDSKGPIIFVQTRMGKNQKLFKIYKFRTMVVNAYEIGGTNTSENDPRITRVGAFLRKTSLDEVPQLLNIIKGEMSIVGPRPILQEEFVGFEGNDIYERRYQVLPGLFCTVDLEYRAEASRETQFKMDAEYVDKMTFGKDIKLFFRIIKTVIKGKNVYKSEKDEKENEE